MVPAAAAAPVARGPRNQRETPGGRGTRCSGRSTEQTARGTRQSLHEEVLLKRPQLSAWSWRSVVG